MTDAEKLALAVLLFHRGGPWTREDHENWKRYTGTPLAFTRTLGDLARRVLDNEQRAREASGDSSRQVRLSGAVIPSDPKASYRSGTSLHYLSPEEGTLWKVEPGSKLEGPDGRGGHGGSIDDGTQAQLPNLDNGGETTTS